MRIAYAVTTYSSPKLVETIHSIPRGERLLIVDNSQTGWSLAKSWNYMIRRLCADEGYDVAIVMNDDVILRPDTGLLLADALMRRQFAERSQIDPWAPGKQLVLISARHASWSDACTDEPDWKMLKAAEPKWQPGPDFSCWAANMTLLQVLNGEIFEGFHPMYYEDNDTHRRIQLAGFEAGAYAPYWHYRSATLRYDAERKRAIEQTFEGNKQKYIARWGGEPGSERFTTPYGRS